MWGILLLVVRTGKEGRDYTRPMGVHDYVVFLQCFILVKVCSWQKTKGREISESDTTHSPCIEFHAQHCFSDNRNLYTRCIQPERLASQFLKPFSWQYLHKRSRYGSISRQHPHYCHRKRLTRILDPSGSCNVLGVDRSISET
mmetsp:Transcript_28766/g.54084  ORF Transcript_28766/g.54084 Transcript_28766/m.54084 type:complete len:143 (-) Transcript_28766:458-886(-)